MRFLFLFLISIVIFFSASQSVLLVYDNYYKNEILSSQFISHFDNFFEFESDWIKDFLNEKSDDILVLSESEEVKSVFDKALISSNTSLSLSEDFYTELDFFKNLKGYEDLIFIDLDRNIIWSFKQKYNLKGYFDQEICNDTGLWETSGEVLINKEMSFSSPVYSEFIEETVIFLVAPVFDLNEDIIGMVALALNYDEVGNSFKRVYAYENYTKIYLIGCEESQLSQFVSLNNLEMRDIDVNEEMREDCFFGNNSKRRWDIYYNDFGERFIGYNFYIEEINSCILMEFYLDDFFEKKEFGSSFIQKRVLILFLILFFVGGMFSFWLDEYYRLNKKRIKK